MRASLKCSLQSLASGTPSTVISSRFNWRSRGQVEFGELGVAECGGHQEELGLGQLEQRYLPGPPSVAVTVVVKFIS